MNKNVTSGLQYAALPYRRTAAGRIEVMLITSRDTGRWIIPKGWPMPGRAPCDSAAQEAREESGVIGRISPLPIGCFSYDKRLENGATTPCLVDVFALEVERQLRSWLEKDQRRTQWFSLEKAAAAVQEPGLSAIIRNLTALLQ